MDKLKQFAKALTECKGFRNLPLSLIEQAKQNDIVIIYGASDDLMEFDGAIYDEVGCYDGGTAYLNYEDGVILDNCDCVECNKKKLKAKTIDAIWCAKDSEWTWTYKTDIPHETFEMLDDDEKYCLGIVFYRKDLKGE